MPLYGELHRFIPALASWYGASIIEVPIKNIVRERGASHYGISRTFRVFFDLTSRFAFCSNTFPVLCIFSENGGISFSIFAGERGFFLAYPAKSLHHTDIMYPTWAADVVLGGVVAGGAEYACRRTSRRNAGAALSRTGSSGRPTPLIDCCGRRAKKARSRSKARSEVRG